MKQILLSLLLLCTLSVSAQDKVITRQKKQTTTQQATTKPKQTQQTEAKPKAQKQKTQTKVQPTESKKHQTQQAPKPQAQPRAVSVSYDANSNSIVFGNHSYRMVYVSGGTFNMGATSEQGSDAYSDEKPVHRVTVSSYYIGQTEVTQALWQAVMGSNPSKWKSDNLPVECVSWDDCQTFIEKLNANTGRTFRLPTEAEWEFAARGGNNSRGYKYSGSNYPDDVAWYDSNSGSKTHTVATKQPNELGIYDMSGNVWEWCSDWYGNYSSSSQTNPTGPNSGSGRVGRGGGWYFFAGYCRVSYRNFDAPDFRYGHLGLRLVLRPSVQ